MPNLRRAVALGDSPLARTARTAYRAFRRFHVPVPRVVGRVLITVYNGIRGFVYFVRRVFIAEPMFRASCTRVGRNVHTGIFVHWVLGDGDILVGDDTTFDGRSGVHFGARFSERPRLSVGNRTYIGHACAFTVTTDISIGDDVYVAAGVRFFDSPGHPIDPTRRLAKQPPSPDQVRPVRVGNNVWIGTEAIIMPGVTIGDGSVVAARAVVTSDVPPYTLVGGMPARAIRSLTPVGGDPEQPAAVLAASGA